LIKRKNNEEAKANSVIEYISNQHYCRSSFLQDYFGDNNVEMCGKCDVCLEKNKLNISNNEFDNIMKAIKNLIEKEPMTVDSIILTIVEYREDKIVEVLQFLGDNGQIAFNEEKKLYWVS